MARYSKDNRWYRGEVRRTWHDKYHIHFVDYGNEDVAVPSNFVKAIPPHLLELPFQALHCTLADIATIEPDWSTSDQQTMRDVTDNEEDFYLDLVNGADEEDQYTVRLSYVTDDASLVDILCREPVGLNQSHIGCSSFSDLLIKLYKSTDDYELLCSAETLEDQITSPTSDIVPSDLATLCRLCRIRYNEEEVLVHLLQALAHVIRKRDDWRDEMIQEDILGGLIKKLTSPSITHRAVAHLLSIVGRDKYVLHYCIADTQCIVSLCELCVYKEDQTPKLVEVLEAIRTLTTVKEEEGDEAGTVEGEQLKGSDHIRREILVTGHVRTLCKFLRDSSDKCLELVMSVLAKMFDAEGNKQLLRAFKEEGGVKDVCRATKRLSSPAVIDIVKAFGSDKEALTLMKKEGLAKWFKDLKAKRRDFGTRFACDHFYKLISSHKVEEDKENEIPDAIPAPPPMTRVPITRPIDEPVLLKEGIDLSNITKEPRLLWYQRKRFVGVSIQLKDVGKHKLTLKAGRTLLFSTWNAGTLYTCNYDLFDDVTGMTSSVNKSEVIVTLTKKDQVRWTTLLRDGGKKATIKLDFGRACDSEDETDSEYEVEELPPKPPVGKDVEICIGEEPSSEDYLTEEEEIGDDFANSFFNEINMYAESDDMDALE